MLIGSISDTCYVILEEGLHILSAVMYFISHVIFIYMVDK
jgi:hypothetical protein